MYEIESEDGSERRTTADVDRAAQALLAMGRTKAVRFRPEGAAVRQLEPAELGQLRDAVKYHREARDRLKERATVPPVPAG